MTGIPVSRMMQASAEKLLKMEEQLHQRVVVRTKRYARRRRDPALACWLGRPNRPYGSFLFLDRRALARPNYARRWRVPFRFAGSPYPYRHVRVHGKALGGSPYWRTARLCRYERAVT